MKRETPMTLLHGIIGVILNALKTLNRGGVVETKDN